MWIGIARKIKLLSVENQTPRCMPLPWWDDNCDTVHTPPTFQLSSIRNFDSCLFLWKSEIEPPPACKNGASDGRTHWTDEGKGNEARNPLCQYCHKLLANTDCVEFWSALIRFNPTRYVGTGSICCDRPYGIWPALVHFNALDVEAGATCTGLPFF